VALALLQRDNILNRFLYIPIPQPARPVVIQVATFIFRKLHAIQHTAMPLETDLCCEKIICADHGFICFTVPKAGSSSLIRLLSPFGARVIICPVDALYERNPEYTAFNRFAVVRNPWARALVGISGQGGQCQQSGQAAYHDPLCRHSARNAIPCLRIEEFSAGG
jgi:hypothetical protein